MTLRLALSVVLFFAFTLEALASGFVLPEELSSISIGMNLADLLKARPKIQKEGMLGSPIDWEAPKIMLSETLPAGGDFSSAAYVVETQKLNSVMLIGHPTPGKEKEMRKRHVARATARWGNSYRRRMLPDDFRPGESVPALTWETSGVEIILILPKDRKKGDSRINALAIQIRTESESARRPLKDGKHKPNEIEDFFRKHDVED